MKTKTRLSRRAFLKTAFRSTVGVAAVGIGSYVYATQFELDWIETTFIQATLPRLTPAFQGYRIAQISDVHADDWMDAERLGEVVTLINAQQPDLVALTGDFVTRRPAAYADILIGALSQLSARDGVVAVLGNHDHWSDERVVRDALRRSGIADICNTVYSINRNGEQLHIAGVDDVWVRRQRLDMVLAQLPTDGAAVLLAHEPDYADVSTLAERFDLQLSGHSHGGQVRLPLIGAPVLPYLGEKYPMGLYQVGTMQLYTNRGVGVLPRIRARLNCRPEISLFTLQTPETA